MRNALWRWLRRCVRRLQPRHGWRILIIRPGREQGAGSEKQQEENTP
jgi:hypothetical protein